MLKTPFPVRFLDVRLHALAYMLHMHFGSVGGPFWRVFRLPWVAEGRQNSIFWRPQLHVEIYIEFDCNFDGFGPPFCSILASSWRQLGLLLGPLAPTWLPRGQLGGGAAESVKPSKGFLSST